MAKKKVQGSEPEVGGESEALLAEVTGQKLSWFWELLWGCAGCEVGEATCARGRED